MGAKIMKKIIFLVAMLLSFNTFSEEINFTCNGVTTGDTIRDSYHSFDLTAITSPPNLIGPRGIMMSCAGVIDKDVIESSCKLTNTTLSCSCKGKGFMKSATQILSRTTGNLNIYGVSKDDIWEGNYSCKKINKKVF